MIGARDIGRQPHPSRCQVNGTEHVAALGPGVQTGARTEREHLPTYGGRRVGSEQDQLRPWMGDRKLPDLGERSQGVRVQHGNIGLMACQDDRYTLLLNACSQNFDALVAGQQLAQPSLQEVVKA